MIDLDALRKVVERATGWGWDAVYRQDFTALIAEVERLREHRESCTENLLKGYETGKAEERAAVVAWLQAASQRWAVVDDPLNEAADAIERGEHRREEKT